MSRQICMPVCFKKISVDKIIKTYCYNVFQRDVYVSFSFFFFNIKQMCLYNAHYEQPLSFVAFFHQKPVE